MALYLTESDIRRLLPMNECIDVLDDLFRQEARGQVVNIGRQRIRTPRTMLNLMGGVALGSQAWLTRLTNLSVLYNTDTGECEAVFQPGALAMIRTGGASGLATRYMAREDAATAGMIGVGRQAAAQLEAVCAVRPIKTARVYSRTPEKRTAFAAEMRERLGIDVTAADSPDDCVRGCDVVIAITNSATPVFDGALLAPGTHVNAAGSNSWRRREVDQTTIERAGLVVVDNRDQARYECGELIAAEEAGVFRWTSALELHEVVSGKVPGRPSRDAITLFESQGIGTEDAACSRHVLEKARREGIGTPLPF